MNKYFILNEKENIMVSVKEVKTNLIQLKTSEIASVRKTMLANQGGRCALCNEIITESMGESLDHQHKFNSEEIGIDGAGLIRGVLCRNCNLLEGKFWNNSNRYLKKTQASAKQNKIEFLRSLITYYENGTYDMIHPNEKPKEQIVSKRNYNKLKKEYEKTGRKKKFPEYPKSKKATVPLTQLFDDFEMNMYN